MKLVFVLLASAWICIPAHAIDRESMSDPVLQERYEALTRELRCAKCQNANIADSPAEISGDFRAQIRNMLLEGKSDDEIKQFLTERYGDFVLYRPPMAPRTLFVWFAPAAALLGGLVAAIVVIRRRSLHSFDDDTGTPNSPNSNPAQSSNPAQNSNSAQNSTTEAGT